jgi:hypothetical protein
MLVLILLLHSQATCSYSRLVIGFVMVQGVCVCVSSFTLTPRERYAGYNNYISVYVHVE